jgi:Mn-dependent DtxR family transcriptional regulator
MKILASAENYLESILMIKKEKGHVRAIDIVNELHFSKPSVSVAMKQLEENGYINRDESGHISLTEKGLSIAAQMYERHDTMTKILIHLGVEETVARDDACKIEHDISEETFSALKNYFQEIL